MNSQFNAGMQPVIFSVRDALHGKPYWRRVGDRISYYKNTYGKKKKIFYTLSFNIQFNYDNDICYIAYHYPYTYTTLMVNWLKRLQGKFDGDFYFNLDGFSELVKYIWSIEYLFSTTGTL